MKNAQRATHLRLRTIRHAFTLLEILLALGLMLIIMAAVLSAIDLQQRVASTGQAEVEQAQLARTLLRMIERDLRSCVFRPEETEENEEAEDEEIIISIDSTGAYVDTSAGVVGDTKTLVIHVSRPPGRLESLAATSAGSTSPMPSDLRSIAYFLAVPGTDGLQGLAGDALAAQSNVPATGIARLDGDRLSIEFSDANGDIQTLVASTRLLASEVNLLQFRYFDGTKWYDAWSSDHYNRLPTAVEITMGFRSSERTSSDSTLPSAAEELTPSRLYRYVVSLPTAASAVLSPLETSS